jgi:glutamate-1-semialdehyde 2,1-aminomutase
LNTQIGVTQRSANAALFERAQQVLPGGSLGNYLVPDEAAFVVARGAGSHVWDVEGREYRDFVLGSGPMVLGHCHPNVLAAVHERVNEGTQFYWLTEPAILLAEEMVAAIPCAEMVKFTSAGAEATFYALRLARAYTGRHMVLRFAGAYHGHHDYGMFGSSAGIPPALGELVLTADFNDLDGSIRQIEQARHDLAAVIVEPIHRIIPPRPGFLEGLRAVTKEYGIMLVFDEVVTGFRMAWGGAQERYGVIPDLATYGKIIGGGFPLAAVAGRRDVMSLSDPRDESGRYVYFSGTFSGNPLSAAAGLAALRTLKQPGTYERLEWIGDYLRDGLRAIACGLTRPLTILGEGGLPGIALAEGDPLDVRLLVDSDRAAMGQLDLELIRRGVFINLSANKFYTSLAHTKEDLDLTLEAFEAALRSI